MFGITQPAIYNKHRNLILDLQKQHLYSNQNLNTSIKDSTQFMTVLTPLWLLFSENENKPKIAWASINYNFSTNDWEYYTKLKQLPTEHAGYYPKYTTPEGIAISVFLIGKNFSYATKAIENVYPDNKPLSLALQLDKSHNIRVHYDEDTKTLKIFTNKADNMLYRRIVALLPAIFKLNLSQDAINVMKLMGLEDYAKWEQALNTFFENSDVIKNKLYNDILKLYSARDEKIKSDLKYNIDDDTSNLETYMKDAARISKRLQENQKQLRTLELEPNAEHTDVVKYLLKHKYIKSITPAEGALYITAQCPLLYTDTTMVQKCMAKYKPFTKWLINKILITNELTMYTYIEVTMDLHNCKVARTNSNPTPIIPQPHIFYCNCWGGNGPLIAKALGLENHISAIEQMMASLQSLNYYDSGVIDAFILDIEKLPTTPNVTNNKTGEWLSVAQLKEIYLEEITPKPTPIAEPDPTKQKTRRKKMTTVENTEGAPIGDIEPR